MAIQNLMNYNNTLTYLNRALDIWGQSCTVFVPKNIAMLGYENQTSSDEKQAGVSGIANSYSKQYHKIWINFNPTKSVFYKFNFFPEEGEELYTAVMLADSTVREECYIRTAVPQQRSIWGDMILQIKKVQDIGNFKTLKRLYFLKPTNNAELYRVLEV